MRTADYSPQKLNGSFSFPFQDLQDALAKAEEICAPNT